MSTPQQTPAVIRATAASQAAVCAECGIAWLSALTAQMPSPAVSINEPATAKLTARRAVRRSISAEPTGIPYGTSARLARLLLTLAVCAALCECGALCAA